MRTSPFTSVSAGRARDPGEDWRPSLRRARGGGARFARRDNKKRRRRRRTGPSTRTSLLAAWSLPYRHVDVIPEVRHPHLRQDRRQARLVEVTRGLLPHRVGHRLGPVAEASRRLRERERLALRVGEPRRVTPCRHGGDALLGVTGFAQLA